MSEPIGLKALIEARNAKEVSEQILDESFDKGALNTNIEEKLNALEAQYEPRLTGIDNKVDQNHNEVSSQLADKANYGEVRLKTVKNELEDMSPAVLAAIEGGEATEFNLLSIPQDDSVTLPKIPKGTLEELNNLAFSKRISIDNDLMNKFNKLGDVNDLSFITSTIAGRTRTKFIEGVPLELWGKSPRLMELTFEYNEGVNAYIGNTHEVSPNVPYYLGAWYHLEDLVNLLGENNYFNPYIIIYNANDKVIGGLGNTRNVAGISSDDVVNVGYKKTSTLSNGTVTYEVVVIEGDWVYIRTCFTISDAEATKVMSYHTRIAKPIVPSEKTLRMTPIILTDYIINPYVNPFANFGEYSENILDVGALTNRVTTIENELVHKGYSSKWFGKEMLVFGDSNSANSGVTVWHKHLAEELNLTVHNYARGGAGYIAKGSTGVSPNIKEQIASATHDPDIVIIFSGGNDYSISVPLGTLTDTGMETFYGGLYNAYTDVINKYPTKIIGVVAQTRRKNEGKNAAGVSVEDQVNATIEMAGHFSLPILNMYHHGGVFTWNQTYIEQFMLDGVHLTTLGQERLKERIKAFIHSL